MPKRTVKRWVAINGTVTLPTLTEQARSRGLVAVVAWKPDMNCWYHLALRGTLEQVAALEYDWLVGKLTFCSRRPRGGWPINLPRRPQPAALPPESPHA